MTEEDKKTHTPTGAARTKVLGEARLVKRLDDRNAADILQEAAATYRERNKIYGDNFKNVGPVMTALFPDGVDLKTEDDFIKWHLFELIIVKLTRFANGGLAHQDSIRDVAVYAAMVERCLEGDD